MTNAKGTSLSGEHERRKGTTKTGKEGVKLSLFAGGMILYIENSEDTTRKILELIHELGKVVGYKINKQKSLVCL